MYEDNRQDHEDDSDEDFMLLSLKPYPCNSSSSTMKAMSPAVNAGDGSGFPTQLFEKEIPEEYLCNDCRLVLNEPHVLSCCGTQVCHTCVNKHYNKCSKISLSYSDSTRSLPNKFLQRSISQLVAYCQHKDNGCSWKGPLNDLQDHLCEECEFMLEYCPLECGSMYLRKNLEEHKIEECPKRPMEAIVQSLSGKIISLEKAMSRLEEQRSKEIEDLKQTNETLRKDLNEQKEQLSLLKVPSLVAPDWLTSRGLSTHLYPPCLLLMTDFSQHKKEDKWWYSPHFYTAPIDGYSMCLAVHANGCLDFSSKGAYVSVHVYIAKGENDDSLLWPFQGDIYVELLNWKEDKDHENKVIKFEPYASKQGFLGNRVTKTLERATRGKGYSEFIAHTELSTEGRHFLHNDSLCFRIARIYTIKAMH